MNDSMTTYLMCTVEDALARKVLVVASERKLNVDSHVPSDLDQGRLKKSLPCLDLTAVEIILAFGKLLLRSISYALLIG